LIEKRNTIPPGVLEVVSPLMLDKLHRLVAASSLMKDEDVTESFRQHLRKYGLRSIMCLAYIFIPLYGR
jgi:hypothetical protein